MSHACAASLFDFKERLVDPYILLTKFRASGGKCMCVVHGSHADQHKLPRFLVRCCDEFLLANNAIVGPRPACCLVSQLTERPSWNLRRSWRTNRRDAATPAPINGAPQRCMVEFWRCLPVLSVDVPVQLDVTGSAIQTAAETKVLDLRRLAPRTDELRRLRGAL
jgi:hypothetical protein